MFACLDASAQVALTLGKVCGRSSWPSGEGPARTGQGVHRGETKEREQDLKKKRCGNKGVAQRDKDRDGGRDRNRKRG